jgi:hypothetical protein
MGFSVDFSLISRLGVFPVVVLVISVVCVLVVLWTSGCVCVCESLILDKLMRFVNLGLINYWHNWCLLLFWPEVDWVWNYGEPTGEEESED